MEKLSEFDGNILTVVGEIHMPRMDLPRRITVVRLTDARLAVWSAIAIDEDEMVALEAYGVPADESGFGGWLLRIAGFAGKEPQIPRS